MGLNPFRGHYKVTPPGSSTAHPGIEARPLPNPDPRNFRIFGNRQVGDHCVIQAHYPDATNYEGVKIMVYCNTDLNAVLTATVLDPHFEKGTAFSPFARFKPTQEGWDAAVLLAESLT